MPSDPIIIRTIKSLISLLDRIQRDSTATSSNSNIDFVSLSEETDLNENMEVEKSIFNQKPSNSDLERLVIETIQRLEEIIELDQADAISPEVFRTVGMESSEILNQILKNASSIGVPDTHCQGLSQNLNALLDTIRG